MAAQEDPDRLVESLIEEDIVKYRTANQIWRCTLHDWERSVCRDHEPQGPRWCRNCNLNEIARLTQERDTLRAELNAERLEVIGAIARKEQAMRVENLALGVNATLRAENEDMRAFIENRGYRRCDIAACNCHGWHGGHSAQRLTEIGDALTERGLEMNGKTILGGVRELAAENERLKARNSTLGKAMWTALDIVREDRGGFVTWPDGLKHAFAEAIVDTSQLTQAEIDRGRELAARFGRESDTEAPST